MKKEVVFLGVTVNTTVRIQEFCRLARHAMSGVIPNAKRALCARRVSQLSLHQRWQIEKAKSIRSLGGLDPSVLPTSRQRAREQKFWFPRR